MSNLDRSLDDIIHMNKASQGRQPDSGPGPVTARRFINRSAGRAAPYSFPKERAADTMRDNSMLTEERAAAAFYPIRGGSTVLETGTKLLISNLDYGVTDEDISAPGAALIQELFSDIGEIKKCSVNYDRIGRSEGTAEVVFSRRSDAELAIKRYNHVQLDGKSMKIEIVGVAIAPSPLPSPFLHDGFRNANGRPLRFRGRGAMGRFKGGRGSVTRRGRGNHRGVGAENISAQDLDADLDKYHADAKGTK